MDYSAFGPRVKTTDAPLRGMTQRGNISLDNRPLVQLGNNQQGTIKSLGINVDGREVLIPTIYDGKDHTDEEEISRF